ncbi:hypothetical protein IV203_004368 [Nitzschia inconspicua]|uniref:Uncharacterized protein n=1 Tax=Nitzschia inconspicua TaxID=303405 RepID=A0A9K3L469_9STRA|nr:hypothetical protein IV203_004368 [Nitzschia inconspicua]
MKQSKSHLQEQQQAQQVEQSATQRHQIRDSTSSARESGCGSIVRSSSLRNVCAVDPIHMASSHDPLSSSWVKDHGQRLTNYVQFLVFGGNTHAEQSGGNDVQGCFISPVANMENISLEDVCDEIVKTFVS